MSVMILFNLFGALGSVGISLLIWTLARLSRRLGLVTRARPHYRWMYFAVSLSLFSLAVRLLFLTGLLSIMPTSGDNTLILLIMDALSALALTICLVVAWHYWSWLLAERD